MRSRYALHILSEVALNYYRQVLYRIFKKAIKELRVSIQHVHLSKESTYCLIPRYHNIIPRELSQYQEP